MGQYTSTLWGMVFSSTMFNSSLTGSSRQRKRKYDRQIPKRSLDDNELQQITYDVLELIHDWFPKLHEQTYFLPPVLMNKLRYKEGPVNEIKRDVQEIQPTLESDWRDDEVMQRMLCCLRALTQHRNEAMVVLLQMQHHNYLNKSCYAAAAARYPRPCDLADSFKRGDFDVLFLHREHGLVVAEIKSVGWKPTGEQDDATVKKKVSQAVKQLNKAERVLGHLVMDLQPLPRVTKTLILPNVTSQKLLTLLEHDADLATDLCHCFDVADNPSAVTLCLCADQMTSVQRPADVTDAILDQLNRWWDKVVVKPWQGCTPSVYELLVARFCGPASTVEIHCVTTPRLEFRTLGHAVHEVGQRMVQFALFPQQLALLQDEEACVYLTGPPGTGKTLLLVLVALKWTRRGHTVHVVSSESFSEAATQLLYYQVTKTLTETDPEAVSRVVLHSNGNNTRHKEQLLSDLLVASSAPTVSDQQPSDHTPPQGGQLFVVADEVDCTFRGMFHELRQKVKDLHVWAATYSHAHRPEGKDGMVEKRLSACLRSTPTVVRRMETAVSFGNGKIYSFENKRLEYLSPTEGPEELYLSHLDHTEGRAMDCVQCGKDIADCLHNQLDVGKKWETFKTAIKTPPPLEYRDVIIIPDWYKDIDDLTDDKVDVSTGQLLQQATGIVQGLRSRGVPVYVVRCQDTERIRDLARASRDAVAVVAWGISNGLERKVVVSVGQGRKMSTGVSGVLHQSSRCVSQLIYVMCPE